MYFNCDIDQITNSKATIDKALKDVSKIGGKHLKKLNKQYIVTNIAYAGELFFNKIYKYKIEYNDYSGNKFKWFFNK